MTVSPVEVVQDARLLLDLPLGGIGIPAYPLSRRHIGEQFIVLDGAAGKVEPYGQQLAVKLLDGAAFILLQEQDSVRLFDGRYIPRLAEHGTRMAHDLQVALQLRLVKVGLPFAAVLVLPGLR